MKNIKMTIKGKVMTLVIDLSKEVGPSSSGKTVILATTEGNAEIPGHPDCRIGVNLFRYPPKAK